MAHRTLLVILLAVSLIATCAKKSSNPVAPTPDQSGYEPLGEAAPRHDAGETGGEAFPAWVRLIAIDPPRGSVVVAEGACPDDCFTYTVEAGSDDGVDTIIEAAFSVDGESPLTGNWGPAPTVGGEFPNIVRTSFGPWRFYQHVGANAPKYRIFRFRRKIQDGNFVRDIVGYARIVLDYK